MKYLGWTLLLLWSGSVAFAAEPTIPKIDDILPEIPKPETAKPADKDAPAPTPVVKRSDPMTIELPPLDPGEDGKLVFYQIPIRDVISEPMLYLVRSGVKEAIEHGADCIVLDFNTPGGSVASLFEIMEVLEQFPGTVVSYVNHDAISAGALMASVTKRIYLAERGRIGDAGIIQSSGEDVPETMRVKLISYLNARIRSVVPDDPFRGEVVRAMMDNSFELKFGDDLVRAKDGLFLTLTAREAMTGYGDPPQPLLGSGIVDNLPALYQRLAGSTPYEPPHVFTSTWSLDFAFWLMRLSSILLGIGGLMLAIEFKTPGFGWVGITGIALILLVMFGHHIAGLSGHEAMLFFLLGVALVFVEVLFFPGALVFGGLGVLIMVGSLLWGMADIWPREVKGVSLETFKSPAYTLALGFLLGVVLFAAVLRFLPRTSAWNRLVLAADIHGTASGRDPTAVDESSGQIGVVVSPLRPTGTIQIGGRRYEARSELGEIGVGVQVRVVRRSDFVVIVEPVQS